LAETVYALDATTIDLCLSVFPWAPFRRAKGAVKLHTLLDLRGNMPSFIHISDGKMHDVNVLDLLLPEQHLRIKAFFGTSENAVKTQIWIAISVYVLVAIVKKRLNLPRSLYENLQILSLTLCEQMPLDELLAQIDIDQNPSEAHNQMNLFD
jgi:hypothetical protein